MAIWSLVAPRKRIVRAFRNLVDEFLSFGVEFESNYESSVAELMDKLQKLDELEPSDKNRICMAVEDAARCHLSTHWWTGFVISLEGRRRMQAAIGVMIASFAIGFLYLLPWPSLPNPYFYLLASLVLMLPIMDVGTFVHSRIPYRYETAAYVIEAIAAFAAVDMFRIWNLHVRSAWKNAVSVLSPVHPKFRMQMAAVPVPQIFRWTLFFIGITCTVVIVSRLINFCGRLAVSRQEGYYSQPAIQCAEVILQLLDISHHLTELITLLQNASADGKGYSNKQGLVATDEWKATVYCVNSQFSSLAYRIKGPWQEVMRSNYGPAGELIASEAPRIELFIRHNQAKNALLSNNLLELRNTMTSTLVNAADANWHLIGAETGYADKVIAQRRTRIIRRMIAIAVSIVGAIAAAHFMRNYPALAVTCGLFAFAELLRLLDPDGPTLLDVAGRLANTLKRGG